ncbi:MAG TPA: thiamine pyrophosphate-dependent dehydrogenase E1 component subunit alpha [Firmicutes bacterium]|nr:thiamine pyrophosphate-dependent dehydrogenase E1 component subunit alpha [Bacillota bacterium]
MYYLMLAARALDERAWVLVRQGKIAFTVGGEGQEAAQVGAAMALKPGVDWVLPYYRDTAVVLALGMTLEEVFLAEFGKANDPNSGGRQMSKHWSRPELRIFSCSSPVATQLPHAVGCALAARLSGEEALAWVSFGDGAVSKGDFHEALNFAAIYRLPVIFFCENNQYAISTPFRLQSPVPRVADRAAAYGIPGITVDGNDVLAVYEAVRAAAGRARAGEGPSLIEAVTYRFAPHTSNDNDRLYRSEEEIAAWKSKDPIKRFGGYLAECGILSPEAGAELARQVHAEVAAAARRALLAPEPLPETAGRFVYAEPESGREH